MTNDQYDEIRRKLQSLSARTENVQAHTTRIAERIAALETSVESYRQLKEKALEEIRKLARLIETW